MLFIIKPLHLSITPNIIKQYCSQFVIAKVNIVSMKILNIHKTIVNEELLDLLQRKLNPLFHGQKQSDINFKSEIKNNHVEISEPGIYDGFLFSIEIKGHELHVTRSEHYVDDVNSLTVESILNELFAQLAADGKVTLILEG